MAFYEWTQNNSGGSFIVNDELTHRLFIEADSLEVANAKALSMGVYYNGVRKGFDCECCGDRWVEPWDDNRFQSMEMSTHFESIVTFAGDEYAFEDYVQMLADEYGQGTPDARIFYKDGTIKEIFKCKGK